MPDDAHKKHIHNQQIEREREREREKIENKITQIPNQHPK